MSAAATSGLDRFELERFLLVIELGLSITQRYQFFTWSQGTLQGLLPHGLLICVERGADGSYLRFDRFSEVAFSDSQFLAVCDTNHGVVAQLIKRWEQKGSGALAFDLYSAASADEDILLRLAQDGLGSCVVHGVKDSSGLLRSFFCFCRLPVAPSPKQAYILELLIPYLHYACFHIQPGDKTKPVQQASLDHLLTPREVGVLELIHQGKTNAEIAEALHLSPYTVKNHVQRMLQKLNVQNRAEAVARGFACGILRVG